MASDVNPGQISVSSLLQGSQVASSVGAQASGKALPPAGSTAAAAATASAAAATGTAKAPPPRATDPQSIVDILNKHLNDSGRPAQYRVDPNSADKLIQEINPANGDVLGEFAVNEFPALARSLGVSGLIVDDVA